uniref:RBPJ-interacting and tubulin-associated protein n=1 Tax=Steinernema glaseri TaxID=37863 RepID=A0A1I7ZAX0_9BILA
MGASLTSPAVAHHSRAPPTSVCNHLFTAGDGPPTFKPQNGNLSKSMFVSGWNWPKKATSTMLPRSHPPSSPSENRPVSIATTDHNDIRVVLKRGESGDDPKADVLPYSRLSVQLDTNQNYKRYEPSKKPPRNIRDHFVSNCVNAKSVVDSVAKTTVITNKYRWVGRYCSHLILKRQNNLSGRPVRSPKDSSPN